MAQSLKKFLSIILLAFCLLVVFMFGGCSNTKLKDGPSESDVVVGNGSMAVTKGDYLYFVNGYKPYSEVGSSNKDGKVTYSALYRVKLNENGVPESVDKKYDSEGNEIFDGSRAIKNVDILASKVVGFEYMGLYIFGDYIYYATPNSGVNKNLETESQYISFYRKKLDRSQGAEHIYTTNAEGSKVSYSMLEIDGNVYLNILDDTNLVVIKNKDKKVTISDVTGAVFSSYSQSTETVTDFNKDIYYTRAVTESDNKTDGNVLCKFNLSSMTAQDVFSDNESTFTLKLLSHNKLYYEKTKKNSASTQLFEASNLSNLTDEICVAKNTYSNYYNMPEQTNIVLVNDGSNIMVVSDKTSVTQTIYSGSATIFYNDGEFVYFSTSDNKIMRASINDALNGITSEAQTLVSEKVKTGQANFASVSKDKLFYFSTNQTNDSVYLHMVDLSDDELTDYFVGVLEKADYDTQEQNE